MPRFHIAVYGGSLAVASLVAAYYLVREEVVEPAYEHLDRPNERPRAMLSWEDRVRIAEEKAIREGHPYVSSKAKQPQESREQ
ncbi:hypothetical protein RI367_002531 [Sorochytrium milnesiophthora]